MLSHACLEWPKESLPVYPKRLVQTDMPYLLPAGKPQTAAALEMGLWPCGKVPRTLTFNGEGVPAWLGSGSGVRYSQGRVSHEQCIYRIDRHPIAAHPRCSFSLIRTPASGGE